MNDDESFSALLLRVRSGESDAAYEIVRRHETAIRVAVRTRLSDPALRRQFDSMDICQSVLASFFLRAAAGQYDLNDPGQLVALLTKMAQNKLAMHSRSQYRQQRDVRRVTSDSDLPGLPPDKSPGPELLAVNRELVSRAYELMDPEVRQIADSRVNGETWQEIATRLGAPPTLGASNSIARWIVLLKRWTSNDAPV